MLDKKAYLDKQIFFGFSNSEFINGNTFSLKDVKSDIGTLTFVLHETVFLRNIFSHIAYLVNASSKIVLQMLTIEWHRDQLWTAQILGIMLMNNDCFVFPFRYI